MAFAKTLTTPTGGVFFQPAEPPRRFSDRLICMLGWRMCGDRPMRAQPYPGGSKTPSPTTTTPDQTAVC
jgi:hypothetical protein